MNKNKYDFLKEAIYILKPNIDNDIKELGITTEDLLNLISNEDYSFKAKYGNRGTKIIKTLFPEKPTGSEKLCVYISTILEFKWCPHCKQYLGFEEFSLNKTRKLGLQAYCKKCHTSTTAETQVARQAKYKSSKLNRTPSWVGLIELEEISEIYANCPKGMQVDHIIPLQGKLVSGLHVPENLQYLSNFDNISKHNKYEIK